MVADRAHHAVGLDRARDRLRLAQVERQRLLDEQVDALLGRGQLLVDVRVGRQADVERVEPLAAEHLVAGEVDLRAEGR